MKYFLGLDVALANNGVCLINENSEIIISKIIETKSKDDIEFRINSLIDGVLNIIEDYKNDLDCISLEGISYGSNGKTFSQICGMHYCLRYELFKKYDYIPITIITPSQLKKFISGKGNCKKDLVILNVFKKYNVEFDNDNLADAFVLAKMVLDNSMDKVN